MSDKTPSKAALSPVAEDAWISAVYGHYDEDGNGPTPAITLDGHFTRADLLAIVEADWSLSD